MTGRCDKSGSPEFLMEFLNYIETVRGLSPRTVDKYFLDLRQFLRFIKRLRGLCDFELERVPIDDLKLDFAERVTQGEVFKYLQFLASEQPKHPQSDRSEIGVREKARAKKLSALKTFYKYYTIKVNKFEHNPVADIDFPRTPKQLPKYLKLDECVALLENVGGRHSVRDYCVLTLFMNCGLRISELVGLNLGDIRGDSIVVRGKGNKERTVYLNDACVGAINDYLEIRAAAEPERGHEKALFLSQKNTRVHVQRVHQLVKHHLQAGGLDATRYSSHKLRHTAATLMLSRGVDIKVLQEILGHEHLNTTEIYTHIENTDLRVAAKANPLSEIRRKGG